MQKCKKKVNALRGQWPQCCGLWRIFGALRGANGINLFPCFLISWITQCAKLGFIIKCCTYMYVALTCKCYANTVWSIHRSPRLSAVVYCGFGHTRGPGWVPDGLQRKVVVVVVVVMGSAVYYKIHFIQSTPKGLWKTVLNWGGLISQAHFHVVNRARDSCSRIELRAATWVPSSIHYMEMGLRKATSEFRTVFHSPLGVPNSQVSLYSQFHSRARQWENEVEQASTRMSWPGLWESFSLLCSSAWYTPWVG